MRYIRFGYCGDKSSVRRALETFRERLGTDSFFRVDGRWSHTRAHDECIAECKRRGYDAFITYAGPSILDAKAYGYPTLVADDIKIAQGEAS